MSVFLTKLRDSYLTIILVLISAIIGIWCANLSFIPLFLLILALIFVAVLIRPRYGVYLIVLFTPLVSSMPRGLLVPFFRPNELILMGVFGIYVFNVFAAGRKVTGFSFVDKVFLVFFDRENNNTALTCVI